MGSSLFEGDLQEAATLNETSVSKGKEMNDNKKLIICLIAAGLIILTGIAETFLLANNGQDYEYQVDIKNTTCVRSIYLGKKLFFHICLKENKFVYDLRYFWPDVNDSLQASIIGVQMSREKFYKMCSYCPLDL